MADDLPLLETDHAHAVVAELGDEQALAAKVDGEMVNPATHLAERDLHRQPKWWLLRRRGRDATHERESKQGKGSETMHHSALLERSVIERRARCAWRAGRTS